MVFNVCTQTKAKAGMEMTGEGEMGAQTQTMRCARGSLSMSSTRLSLAGPHRISTAQPISSAGAGFGTAKDGGTGEIAIDPGVAEGESRPFKEDPGFDPPDSEEGGNPLTATGAPLSFSDMPTVTPATEGSLLVDLVGFGDAGVLTTLVPSSEELARLEMVIEAGGVRALVMLCAGPGGFDTKPTPSGDHEGEDKGVSKGKAKGGKKKGGKSKKSPPVPPEMAEAQLSASGVLRRMTVRADWAAAVAQAEGARMLLPLMNSKNDQTRWHAQAALWNISGDSANAEVLNENKAPVFLTTIVPYKGDKTGVYLTTPAQSQREKRPSTAPV